MRTRVKITKLVLIALVGAAFVQTADSQTGKAPVVELRGANSTSANDAPDRLKTLRAAATALGMVRWSDIGAGTVRLPGVDVVTTMELWGSGTTYGPGQPNKAGASLPAFKTEYHAAIAYNPPAMRVEMTRTSADAQGGAAQHTIEVVREKYAWDESEIGAGLVPGKGLAAPALAAVNSRLLRLWILPYGIVKAALAAGDKTTVSVENGATVITFPLSGQLAGVMVKATLDTKNLVTKVETRTDNPGMGDMVTETEYSDYADHGEIPTDVISPGHVVQKQNGRPFLDIRMKMVDGNNPYQVFPVPENVKKAAAH